MVSQRQVIRSDFLNSILLMSQNRTGIISGLAVEPTDPASMNVIVRAGSALISKSLVELADDTTVSISTPDPDNPRFDLITLKSDATLGYYTGTAEPMVALDTSDPKTAVKPVPPTTPAGETPLAEVWVPADATAIDTIIDRRIFFIADQSLDQVDAVKFDAVHLADGKKQYYGADDDFSIYFDSATDSLRFRDEVNATESYIPRKASVNLAGPISKVTVQTADYTASLSEVVLVDASSGAVTITLPAPSTGAIVWIKKIDNSPNAVTIAPNATEKIDGASSFIIAAQYESYTLVSDGTDWFVV